MSTVTHAEPIGYLEPGTPEWAAARTERLGGSEVAPALGISNWDSPFTLWHRKRGLIGPAKESPSMYWGKLHEATLRAEYARRHPEVIVTQGDTWVNGWRTGAPDGQCYVPELGVSEHPIKLWEGKTASAFDAYEWGDDGSDDPGAIPPYYRVQCLWYMDVVDVHALDLSVLIDNSDYREYTVPWDPDEAAEIRTGAEAFWQTVVDDIRPPLDWSESTYDTVRELHPDIDGEDIEIPADVGDEFLISDLALKDAKEAARGARIILLDAMGTARRALVAGTPVARRQPHGSGSVALYPIHPKE